MFNLLRRSRTKKSRNNDIEATTQQHTTAQRYRQFSDVESNTVLPTASTGQKHTRTRAVIDELDDLQDLDEADDDDDEDDEDDARHGYSYGTSKRRCRQANVDKNYTASRQGAADECCSSGEQENQMKKEKIDLAKTAASAEATLRNLRSKTNSAIKTNRKVCAFSSNDFETINKIVAIAATTTLDNDDNDNNYVNGRLLEENSKTVKATSTKNSPNEAAEWQGHVSTIGKCERFSKIIEKYSDEQKKANESKQFNNVCESITSKAPTTTTTTAAIKVAEDVQSVAAAGAATSNSYSNSNTATTATATATATTAHTVINEAVKYRRNLGNTRTTTQTTPFTELKNTAEKRQSRLSLTLGFNSLTGSKKSKSVESVSQQVKKKLFFSSNTKNKNNQKLTEQRPNSSLFYPYNKANDIAAEEVQLLEQKKVRATLQRGKEFFSDIFMARGRNHNRHNKQYQQQQQQQQQTKQQQQQQQQEPCKHAAVSLTSNNHNNNHIEQHAMNINHSDNHPNLTHLETSYCDPSTSASTSSVSCPLPRNASPNVATNSYQMTMSNNSPKNFSHVKVLTREQQRRSNSAEHVRSPNDQSDMLTSERQIRARSLSQEPHALRLNAHSKAPQENFIHATNIESNGVSTANHTNNANINYNHNNNNNNNNNNTKSVVEQRNDVTTSECETFNGATRRQSAETHNSANQNNDERLTNDLKKLSACEQQQDKQHITTTAAAIPATTTLIESAMGQTNGKIDTVPTATPRRASTPREFRESVVPEAEQKFEKPKVIVPKITVVDYSDGSASDATSDNSPVEQEVFYDFENGKNNNSNNNNNNYKGGLNISEAEDDGIEVEADDDDDDEEDDDDNDEVFHEQIPTTVYQQKWSPAAAAQMRHSHVKLENVPEEEDDDDDDDEDESDDEDDDDDENVNNIRQHKCTNNKPSSLDSENLRQRTYDSAERKSASPLKSTNTSDSNLSTSFPDSGIGDMHTSSSPSLASGNASTSRFAFNGDNETCNYARSAAAAKTTQKQHHLPFVRDGNSTDCEETLLQYDDLDYLNNGESDPHERLVCIESICLPDVVVESTTGSSGSNSAAAAANASAAVSAAAAGEHIININGASGNSMGNVHFIPIHVEGDSNKGSSFGSGNFQKRRSVDDSVIGSGGKTTSFAHMNGHYTKPTIEIIEDASEMPNSFGKANDCFNFADIATEKLKREFNEQKARFNAQLEDAQKNINNLQTKAADMQMKIEKLEQELATKTWNVDRLQSELSAAQKEDEYVRKKLILLEDEKTNLRHRYSESEDEFKERYANLEVQYKELEARLQQNENLATQLSAAQGEVEILQEQIRILKSSLENSEAERKICQDKWQKEFEMLRTQNMDREESLMTDCEWQLRQMQRQCKDKLDKSECGRKEALEKAEHLEEQLEIRRQEVQHLRTCQAEVKSLRGVVTEQENAIQNLMDQVETLKAELQAANENLEEQIKAVKRIKYQCDNALCDKERQVMYRIDEVRNQAAAFWEDKLYTEMTRLKNELESVYVDERRESLDKLQAEHIEELRALTTRYTANEEELRQELAELQERYDNKSEEFLELREKSDNTLLTTRMHLDRADREFQNAMCREDERREALEVSLRKEFETEKLEMEEKFRERITQVKEEFAKELQTSTQDLTAQHKKELEKHRAKLQAERDESIQELVERHRKKMAAAEDQINDIELRQQHDLNDLKAAYDTEKAALDKRDISNANEIEQLHRKCRCLTNLFEEMRMRYERRDPRPEDLREIAELRSRCESQERDLYLLTDRLRDMQIQMSELQGEGNSSNSGNQVTKSGKSLKKPPPKTIPTSCDVIYEENEERESPPPPAIVAAASPKPLKKQNETAAQNDQASDDEDEQAEDDDDDDDDAEDDDEEEDEDEDEEEAESETEETAEKSINTADLKANNKKNLKIKNVDTINEDDSHMITAV